MDTNGRQSLMILGVFYINVIPFGFAGVESGMRNSGWPFVPLHGPYRLTLASIRFSSWPISVMKKIQLPFHWSAFVLLWSRYHWVVEIHCGNSRHGLQNQILHGSNY